LLIAEVKREMKQTAWKIAYLDVRSSAVGTSRLSKFRVAMPDGSLVSSLSKPARVVLLLSDLWELQQKLFPEKWYGLVLTVYPDGKCETEFNYDPKCIGDPKFFET